MGVLKSVEPTGFLAFAPAFAGTIWADVNRRIIQNCPHGRRRCLSSPPVWFRLCRLRVQMTDGLKVPRRGVTAPARRCCNPGGARDAAAAEPEAGFRRGARPEGSP